MASCWDTITEVNPNKIRHILDVAGISAGQHVLDIGTGTGVLIPYIEEKVGAGGAIDAVDISERMLDEARKKHGSLANVRFINKDIESDNIDDAYDVIMMYCMYPHLERPIETLRWLTKVNLNPGGRLVIAFPESRTSINGIHRHNDGSVHSDRLIEGHAFASALEAAGMKVKKVEDTSDYYIIVLENQL